MNRSVADLTTEELVALVRRAVREELAASKPRKAAIPAPERAVSPEVEALVRRSLRRKGIAA